MSARRRPAVRSLSPAAPQSPGRVRFYSGLLKTIESIQGKLDDMVVPQETAPAVTVVDHVWTQLLLHYPHIGKVAPMPLNFENKQVILVIQFTIWHMHEMQPALTDIMLTGQFGVLGVYLRGYSEMTKRHFPLATTDDLEYLVARLRSIGRLYILHKSIMHPAGAAAPSADKVIASVQQLLLDAAVHINEMDCKLISMDTEQIAMVHGPRSAQLFKSQMTDLRPDLHHPAATNALKSVVYNTILRGGGGRGGGGRGDGGDGGRGGGGGRGRGGKRAREQSLKGKCRLCHANVAPGKYPEHNAVCPGK